VRECHLQSRWPAWLSGSSFSTHQHKRRKSIKLHCSLNYVNALYLSGISDVRVAQWGYDYNTLPPSAFNKSMTRHVRWMVTANVACRDGCDKDASKNAGVAVGADVSDGLSESGN
jgi:hypothetical protein